ncbi:LysE/ArgO family amino acid transporter [Massilia sp. YIM B02763]|uniref:LysE/ArgO family amino acid transporter n=1 Tax=Massilia sp. YIM B02763 TaxID=3050130 RepID=UPI0025B724D3|nr:LysE/ArgO family amino acid transporter [Massilia sp. YIM B02763]MDN4055429.1 LysE/ArgO family amino acid transporter [Massilia sp. YIM B02763]
MFSPSIFLQGLGLGASLIMPIGAQNAHVIRTAVRGRHVLPTVAACILIDVTLIALGMSGFGALVESSPRVMMAARWGGAAFLLWYGLRCLRSAWRGQENGVADDDEAAAQPGSASRALGLVLALSLLNPHVYLDTVVLLGAVGSSLAQDHRTSFAAGAMTASLLWFSGLGLAARRCAFVLARPKVWRAIETFTGLTMLVLAALLVRAA